MSGLISMIISYYLSSMFDDNIQISGEKIKIERNFHFFFVLGQNQVGGSVNLKNLNILNCV